MYKIDLVRFNVCMKFYTGVVDYISISQSFIIKLY